MDTALKHNEEKHFLSFSRKLFLSVISLFIVFAACFIAYQYQREKEYKVELLNMQLQDYNDLLHLALKLEQERPQKDIVDNYVKRHSDKKLRVTLIDLQGNVIYDSNKIDEQNLRNHSGRPEVSKALKEGKGYDVRRTSETTGTSYFYSATHYSDIIIRTALPYDLNLIKSLSADLHYIWFTLAITLLLIFVFYKFTSKLGTAINHLREFAKRADRNEPFDTDLQSAFPHNELGEISQHIIQIYKRLRETKEALYIEREKLIMHLQTSREGLGIFTKDKKEILVNNLFTQYGNLISDSNLQTTEEIFSISEFQKLMAFIDKVQKRPTDKEEKRMSIHINKNGRMFVVECIVFQDSNFEISINDISRQEEESRMKRQLTQNVAHELKTPVSSIQGYLETIISNPQLPDDKRQFFLERCYSQSTRLTGLLRDISVLNRLDEASEMFELSEVNIQKLVGEIEKECSKEMEEKKITTEVALPGNPTIYGNYSLLYSIFRNLYDNAIAYAGEGIHLTVSCYKEDPKFYYFSFSDNGVGVSEEHVNRIFERFYRVDKGRSRKVGGTGLGLSIVKNGVNFHKGQISAKSGLGKGMTFFFTLKKKI